MSQKSTRKGSSGNLLEELLLNLQLGWRLMTDPRVSLVTKALMPVLAGIYLIIPIDLLPDVIPVLGQLDDVAVMLLLVRLFISLAPSDVVEGHRATMWGGGRAQHDTASGSQPGAGQPKEDDVIDAEFRVVNDA